MTDENPGCLLEMFATIVCLALLSVPIGWIARGNMQRAADIAVTAGASGDMRRCERVAKANLNDQFGTGYVSTVQCRVLSNGLVKSEIVLRRGPVKIHAEALTELTE